MEAAGRWDLTRRLKGYLVHIYRQSVENGQVANICTRSMFPRLGKYPQLTNVSRLCLAWERDF